MLFGANLLLVAVALALVFVQPSGVNRLRAYQTPIFRQSCTAVTIFSVFLIFYTSLASRVNDVADQEMLTLSSHMVRHVIGLHVHLPPTPVLPFTYIMHPRAHIHGPSCVGR
jgi:hypothetical protein